MKIATMTIVNGLALLLVFSLLACTSSKDNSELSDHHIKFTQYSQSVNDTFFVEVQLPKEYYSKPGKTYPVVILLDGNFYFPIMSSIVQQYEIAGLMSPVILVGVGYKSFKTMDSLRVRDYLFPKAMPSDELEAVGGGDDFLSYLTTELLPDIDSHFRTEKQRRALLGHSFGGYFVLYSLLNQTTIGKSEFRNFVAASPTLWYNNFHMNQLPDHLGKTENEIGIFMSVGQLEDSIWSVKPVIDLTMALRKSNIPALTLNSTTYSDLEHMDVAVLTFTKGLQKFYSTGN